MQEKNQTWKLFLCEVSPLRRSGRYHIGNSQIDLWNSLLHDKYKDKSIQIINLNQQIHDFNNPETLFYDDIHFNYQLGLPLIKNKTV